jgi:hypothetical protein
MEENEKGKMRNEKVPVEVLFSRGVFSFSL